MWMTFGGAPDVHGICTDVSVAPAARGSVPQRSSVSLRLDAAYHAGASRRRQMLKQGYPTRKAAPAGLAEVMSSTAQGIGRGEVDDLHRGVLGRLQPRPATPDRRSVGTL